jgi:hypothetical protein
MRSVYEDDDVCYDCADNYYVMAYVDSTLYKERIHEDNVITFEGEYYHMEYLDHHDLVEVQDGEYAKEEDTYETNSDDIRVLKSDVGPEKDWVLLHDGIAYPRHEVYCCYASLTWYLIDDAEPVEFNGKTYHPEHLPVTLEETE